MANPKGQLRDKPFREALNIERLLAEKGEETPAKPGSLRYIARQLLNRAAEDTPTAKEVADRLDGKVAQSLEHTGADGGPIQTEERSPVDHARRVAFALNQGVQQTKPH
jgi:hypothetical protein